MPKLFANIGEGHCRGRGREVVGKREGAQWGPCPSTGVWMGMAEMVLDQEAQNELTTKCLGECDLLFNQVSLPQTWRAAPQFQRPLSSHTAPSSS